MPLVNLPDPAFLLTLLSIQEQHPWLSVSLMLIVTRVPFIIVNGPIQTHKEMSKDSSLITPEHAEFPMKTKEARKARKRRSRRRVRKSIRLRMDQVPSRFLIGLMLLCSAEMIRVFVRVDLQLPRDLL